jgi:hypothetical protein
MFTINKTLVLTAAVIAAGLVAAIDMAQSRTEPTAAATVAARFPAQGEMMVSLNKGEPTAEDRKTDKSLMPSEGCSREHWPYIADECLTSPNGASVKKPTRTITIERRVATNASQLVRVPVTQVASR